MIQNNGQQIFNHNHNILLDMGYWLIIQLSPLFIRTLSHWAGTKNNNILENKKG